jgi:eukaryotic-like serine/threonine-protein kinase
MMGEQRLCSVLLVARRPRAAAGEAAADLALRQIVDGYGGRIERLLDGTGVVRLDRRGAATDQAAAAARCALTLRRALPDRRMALATGQGQVGAPAPAGPAIERAARLFEGATADGGIRVDVLTAGLLDARFEIEAGEAGLSLRGERAAAGVARRVLGKITTCVGRERELRALVDLFDACASEPEARAVLVEGDAGVGKSRLREEILRTLEARGAAVGIWIARGDPMRAGAPFGLVGQLVRAAAGIGEGEPIERRRDALRARVARRVEAAQAPRVTEFLGELAGTPFPDDQRRELAAARQSPKLMGDQMRRAWVDLLDAETRRGPLVLVLEDLHWGDAPTVEHVDTALRLLKHRPLLVLALGRPAVRELFPRLWAGRNLTELRLGGLPRRACEELARQVLGEVTPGGAAALWERSQGNAFFLEELLRAEAEGGRAGAGAPPPATPPTVLAMLQTGIEALDLDARRVLRAGSVFGQAFRGSAVLALLGDQASAAGLSTVLAELERREWVAERGDGILSGDRAYVFRHALVRDAAYGTLTDEDRALGHRLAGTWLVDAGEPDASEIAEHFDRGGEPARAVSWYLRAAEQALEGNDLAAAIGRADRAASLGAEGATLAALHLVRAEAHSWRGALVLAEREALAAAALWPEGSDPWLVATRRAAITADRLGHHDYLDALAEHLARLWSERPDAEVTAAQVLATAQLASCLILAGRYARAAVIHAGAERVAARFAGDPAVAVQLAVTRAMRAYFEGDLQGMRAAMTLAVRDAEDAGNLRGACNMRYNLAWAHLRLGAYEEAAATSRAALDEAERMGLTLVATRARHTLALSQFRAGHEEGVREVMTETLSAFAEQGQGRFEGTAHVHFAEILHRAGDLGGAEREARRAVDLLGPIQPLLPLALGHLSRVLRERGRTAEALSVAQAAAALLDAIGIGEDGAEVARLALAEALDAAGDRTAALAALGDAARRLRARAARIPDDALRASFLDRVPENARTLALARAWEAP